MKIKVLSAMLLTVCLAFAASGCGTPQDGSDSSIAEDQVKTVETTAEANGNDSAEKTADYSTVLEKYKELKNTPSYFNEMDEKAWENAENIAGEIKQKTVTLEGNILNV